ncbi:MAG TPA: ATP-binding protein [Actinomycetota bacterium]|nr:ATP-binding protein [Actinomycetota bacterium]
MERRSEQVVHLTLPCRPESAAVARHVFDELDLPANTLADAQLLTTELVTNSIVHAAGERIELDVVVGAAHVHVAVCDEGGPSEPRVRRQDVDDTSGRGLFLVDAIADEWGSHVDGRTAVWFRLRRR